MAFECSLPALFVFNSLRYRSLVGCDSLISICVSFNDWLCAVCLQSCENMKVHSEAHIQIHTLYTVAFERLTGE